MKKKLLDILTFSDWHPKVKWGVLLVVFCGIVLTFIFGINATINFLRLIGEGVETRGQIISKYTEQYKDEDGDLSVHYFIMYQFDAGLGDPPSMQIDSREVTEEQFNRYEDGQGLTIQFLMDNPEVNSTNPQADYESAIRGLICAGGGGIIVFLVILINLSMALRRRRENNS